MNDPALDQMIDSLTSQAVNQSLSWQPPAPSADVDWTIIAVIFMVILLPVLILFLYLGYRRYLRHQRQRLNDELILQLAREGHTLTPEVIDTIRRDESSADKPADNRDARTVAYNKLCTGGAFFLGGLVVLFRNRFVAIVMMVVGLFLAAQGLALYLSQRNQ